MTINHCDTGSMIARDERDFYFAIQQRQFRAKMTNRVRLRLLRRITQIFHDRALDSNVATVSRRFFFPMSTRHRRDSVTVRNQMRSTSLSAAIFGFRIFENRIREPRIDEQNFSARGHN